MKNGDTMKRDDGVEFTVVDMSHWSLVTAKGLMKEEDRVKWVWDAHYVGHSGNGYTLVETLPT